MAALVTSTPKSSTSVKTTQQYRSLDDFLFKHLIKKDDSTIKVCTNTRIGVKGDPNFYGGNYHIPDEEYPQFLDLYHRDIIAKKGKEYLTEKQLDTNGPILVDLDFRHAYDVDERQYTDEHVRDLVDSYLAEIKTIYQINDSVQFQIFILEKPTVNRLADKQITKDGIHMIICIQADRVVQMILRERIIAKVSEELWADFPITNAWTDVFDEGISKGTTNWQLFDSRKPNHEKYKLTRVFDIHVDDTDNEFIIKETSGSTFDVAKNIQKLSIRYKKHASLFLQNEFVPVYEEYKRTHGMNGPRQQKALVSRTTVKSRFSDDSTSMVMKITSSEELQCVVDDFLEHISTVNYELREAYDYTMILPPHYYEEGSYSKWIRVGWVLKNIDSRLLIVFIAFSAKAKRFQYSDIPELCEKWKDFDSDKQHGLTKRSLMYWTKQDVPKLYADVRRSSIDHYIEKTINNNQYLQMAGVTPKVPGQKMKQYECGDFELATVLYHLYKDQFVCVGVRSNTWREYKNNRWVETDSGTALRRKISEEVRELYQSKANNFLFDANNNKNDTEDKSTRDTTLANTMDGEVSRKSSSEYRLMKTLDICQRLVGSNDKNRIMTEARELFYDGEFLQSLDTNPYLMCFKNGVVDFKEKVFRKGRPEDYLSLSTNINYLERIIPEIHEPIMKEINDFMDKLFPRPELCKYMWDHLASTLVGNSANQTMNMYIGNGQNGKSVLVNLMELVLGDYKGDVPLTMITGSRANVGSVTPEIVQLKGIRYAVMQEPSKDDVINEGPMKALTSGTDVLTGRAPYMTSSISFVPQLKLVVCSNTLMKIKTTDHGTWRRIRVVPFESLFTENPVEGDKNKPFQFKLDMNIKERFPLWKEVFAYMLVQRVFETDGIVQDCSIVMAASNDYRKKEDKISEFIQDKVVRDSGGKIRKMELNSEFGAWHDANYGRSGQPNPKDLHECMNKEFGHLINGMWSGVKIRYDRNEADDDDDAFPDDIGVDEL